MKQIATILQEAIRETAECQYVRLSAQCTPDKNPLICTEAALRALKGLQDGTQPEYDPWVAMYYLTWYQYPHVNLACAILDKLFHGDPIEEPMHVIDLACGAMATQFALAVYSATLSPKNRTMPSITMYNIDPSESMRSIGCMLWKKFKGIANQNCVALSNACHSIDFKNVSSQEKLKDITSGRHILIAMHAVYDRNKNDIKSTVQKMRNRFGPIRIVMTCNNTRENLAKYAGGDGWQKIDLGKFMTHDNPLLVTKWRRDLLKRLPRVCDNSLVSNYLSRAVVNWPNNPVAFQWVLHDRS